MKKILFLLTLSTGLITSSTQTAEVRRRINPELSVVENLKMAIFKAVLSEMGPKERNALWETTSSDKGGLTLEQAREHTLEKGFKTDRNIIHIWQSLLKRKNEVEAHHEKCRSMLDRSYEWLNDEERELLVTSYN